VAIHKQHQSHRDTQASTAGRQKPQQAPLELQLPRSVESILQLQRLIGNKATTALIQRQQEEEGSATISGAARADEEAADEGSLTKQLTDEQDIGDADSDEEMTEGMKQEATEVIKYRTVDGLKTQHPTFAQMGIRPKEILGNKLGVYVGNEKYKHNENWGNLPGATADMDSMKSAMEGNDYDTVKSSKNKGSKVIGSIFKSAVNKAKAGDALLLYYAGHGLPGGIVGVNSKVEGKDEKKEGEQNGDGTRGGILEDRSTSYQGYKISDIEKYATLLQSLEYGVSKGVHTTLIADACHSGAAADLVRDKAVEKLAKSEDSRVKAVSKQINRLKDIKKQIPEKEGEAGTGGGRGLKLTTVEVTLEKKDSPYEDYWKKVVLPELEELAKYLKEAGLALQAPKAPSDYSAGGIAQVIDQFINQLVDLGEKMKSEEKKSTLSIAP
jgi:hypothetical protein